MPVETHRINVKTHGDSQVLDLTPQLVEVLGGAGITDGIATLFVVGSTAGITTFEYEPGLIRDLKEFYEKAAPANRHYHHDDTWGDANGFSHVRAAFTGPSLTIPFEKGKVLLGTWQQVVLAEFDNRARDRQIVVHILGE